jgi:hypothetical protein
MIRIIVYFVFDRIDVFWVVFEFIDLKPMIRTLKYFMSLKELLSGVTIVFLRNYQTFLRFPLLLTNNLIQFIFFKIHTSCSLLFFI